MTSRPDHPPDLDGAWLHHRIAFFLRRVVFWAAWRFDAGWPGESSITILRRPGATCLIATAFSVIAGRPTLEHTVSGCWLKIWIRRREAWEGWRTPCSQLCTVLGETLSMRANTA